MNEIQQVKEFARDFVNGKGRTDQQKEIIRHAYRQVTGKQLRRGCITCYIEAIFTIIHAMPKPQTVYQLKPGALLQAFSDASKTCTNANLTDELAEFHLSTNPGCIKFFTPASQEIWRMKLAEGGPEDDLEIVPAHDGAATAEKPAKKTAGRKPAKHKK